MSEEKNTQAVETPKAEAAGAAPVKPKRPKSKSQLMAAALLDKAYTDTMEAKARGYFVIPSGNSRDAGTPYCISGESWCCNRGKKTCSSIS